LKQDVTVVLRLILKLEYLKVCTERIKLSKSILCFNWQIKYFLNDFPTSRGLWRNV